MQKLKYLFTCFMVFYGYSFAQAENRSESLVCIHGILGSPWNMTLFVNTFETTGMQVTNWGYPSRDKTIEEHAADLVKELRSIAEQKPAQPIHFVTHSMGGLILRAAVNHPDCPEEAKLGRAVLLAPPNRGACWGRMLEQVSIAKKIARDKAGLQLMTEQDFDHLGTFPEAMRVLVIAGNWGFNPFIPGENDGTVAVEETFLTTPHDHVVISTGHKSILINPKANTLAKEFIFADVAEAVDAA